MIRGQRFLAWLFLVQACGQEASFADRNATRKKSPVSPAIEEPSSEDATEAESPTEEAVVGPNQVASPVAPVGPADPTKVVEDEEKPTNAGFAFPGSEPQIVLERLRRLPKFGMLVNDLQCGLCHVQVIGDVVSTREVEEPRHDSETWVTGNWFAAASFAAGPWVHSEGGIQENYTGPKLPKDKDSDGKPNFPAIQFSKLADKMLGKVSTGGLFASAVARSFKGNLVLIGTRDEPIRIERDVFVDGDLVIKGYYTGNGTIYATGNIYIPADLRSLRSAFPFSNDPKEAREQAARLVTSANTDSLGLASANSILIADLDSSLYTHPTTPENRQADSLRVFKVFDWFPGGKEGFDALYERAYGCATGAETQLAGFNLIEAFLYAQNTVAGISRGGSYAIRGGVIADYMHILSGALFCTDAPSPLHGRAQNRSYIEYDYRLETGRLKMLEYLADEFPEEK